MADEVTHEDVMRVRRWECQQEGHIFEVVAVSGSLDPQQVLCSRCGAGWAIDTGRLEEIKVRVIEELTTLDDLGQTQTAGEAIDWVARIETLEQVLDWITEDDDGTG